MAFPKSNMALLELALTIMKGASYVYTPGKLRCNVTGTEIHMTEEVYRAAYLMDRIRIQAELDYFDEINDTHKRVVMEPIVKSK